MQPDEDIGETHLYLSLGLIQSTTRQSRISSRASTPQAGATVEQTFAHRIADELFHRIAHWTRAELRVKSLSHEERQNRLVQFQFVTARGEELDFTRQELLRDLQLVFVAQAMEHELLVHAREDFRAQGLLRSREDVAFQRRVVGVLQAHQFRRADV